MPSQSDLPPEVRYGLLSKVDYEAIANAQDSRDMNEFARIVVPLCADNVPLYNVLFLGDHPTPHIWADEPVLNRNMRVLARYPRGHSKTTRFTTGTLAHRISYSVVPGSPHEDPRVLALFETRERANDRLGAVRQLFESGGPSGLIGKVFRGAPHFPNGEETPWAGMSIVNIAKKWGKWNDKRIILPHPRRLSKPDPNIASLSPGEGSVGFQPRLVLADDIVGQKAARSDAERRKVKDWWKLAIDPVIKPFTRVVCPHTLFHEDDNNSELGRTGFYHVLERKALNRYPTVDDYEVVRNEDGAIMDIRLTAKGKELIPLFGCPEFSEADCPCFTDPSHIDPALGGTYHRPVKDLIAKWIKNPWEFALFFMHDIRGLKENSIKPWMLRFFCSTPGCPDRHWGKVSEWHQNWEEWREDRPDAGLSKDAPTIALFTPQGVRYSPGDDPVPIQRTVHGWDLGFGRKRTNDLTACARTHRTRDGNFFTFFEADRWRHDTVWRKIVLSAVTDPHRPADEVALEVDTEQIYPQEVRKLMTSMGYSDRFKLTEVYRGSDDKDKVFHNSGLPVTMNNGLWHMDVHDREAIDELLSVTPDQQGAHDDRFDAAVNAYQYIRRRSGLNPGPLGKPLPPR